MTNTAMRRIMDQQRAWADRAGHHPDRRGYLPRVDDNLRKPLNDETRSDFANGSGNELKDKNGRPAKLRALHSSAALACNFFDFWRHRDNSALAHALDLDCPIVDLCFEKKLRSGVHGMPPNLDLFLTLASHDFVAIECKFTEPYGAKSKAAPFKAKYFPARVSLWADRGLPQCQRLATEIHSGSVTFQLLNSAQLLKHALGARRDPGKRISLLYLFYHDVGPEGEQHRADIATFAEHLNGEVGFRALSYQDLFARLRKETVSGCDDYLSYLADRYFQ